MSGAMKVAGGGGSRLSLVKMQAKMVSVIKLYSMLCALCPGLAPAVGLLLGNFKQFSPPSTSHSWSFSAYRPGVICTG